MSEYLRKQALVQEISGKIDWLIGRSEVRSCGHENNARVISEFASLRGRIQSGAFDVKDDLDEIIRKNHSLAVKMKVRTLELEDEIQRLRAALERIRKITKESREAKYYVDNYLLIEVVAEQALSTTTEPTGAERVSLCMECDSGKGA